jgi:peptide/nickel transport system substrate-binding protein
MSSTPWRGRAIAAVTAIVMTGVAAGCSSGNSSSGPGGSPPGGTGGVLVVATGATAYPDDFNLYSPNAEAATNGMIYEPLFFYDTAKAGVIKPWLGTSYAWSNGGKTLTVQLRHGVQWTDGKPFTSTDVVFTFDQALHSTALNKFGLPLAGVAANGPYGVTINFTKPAYTDAYYALGRVEILPKHIWQSVKNPVTWQNQRPVGTGAYTVTKYSPQVFELTANPHYYLPGLPHFKTLRFLAYSGNETLDAAVEAGTLDWSGAFIPNIKQTYLTKNPKFAVSDIPLATTFLVPNMTSAPSDNLAVRQAISAAINRALISGTVYNGYAPATNPEALIRPNYDAVLDPALASASFGSPGAARAKSILSRAGVKTPVNITVKMVAGYTDYLSILQIMQQELKPAGINLTIDQEAYTKFISDQDNGNFQFLIDNFGYTPDPWSYYYTVLDSQITKPVGQADTVGDFGRYRNPQVDSLLSQIAGTVDPAVQKPAFYRIEQIFTQQMPDIPVVEAQDEIEFNGNHVTGYPTVTNPYGAPAVYIQPDTGWIAARLVPVPG